MDDTFQLQFIQQQVQGGLEADPRQVLRNPGVRLDTRFLQGGAIELDLDYCAASSTAP